MPLITEIFSGAEVPLEFVPVVVDRHTLARRRWRTTAADGTDIAVDLEKPCHHGDLVWAREIKAYRIAQVAEPVLEIPIPIGSAEAAALGWYLGNQHLPVEITSGCIRLEASSHLRERLDREGIAYHQREAVFRPAPHSVGHTHGHSHG